MEDDFEAPEKSERPKSQDNRLVGLIIATLAGVLAFVTHLSNENDLDRILAHVSATDQRAFYHEKLERCAELNLQLDSLRIQFSRLSAADQVVTVKIQADYMAEIRKLKAEGEEIKVSAEGYMQQFERLAEQDNLLDIGKVGLQVSVVLCSITVLTEHRIFTYVGVSVAFICTLISMWALLVMG